jgi:hypothetical protein
MQAYSHYLLSERLFQTIPQHCHGQYSLKPGLMEFVETIASERVKQENEKHARIARK